MGWDKFKDRLGLLLIVGVPLLWVSSNWLALPGEVIGATIGGWTLVIQYYFRKKEPS